jgi:hypothetical protein
MARRRRSRTAILAERTILDIKRKEREFLKEVSRILTEALGFPVKVSHVKTTDAKQSPRAETFRRKSKRELQQQMADAFAPLTSQL